MRVVWSVAPQMCVFVSLFGLRQPTSETSYFYYLQGIKGILQHNSNKLIKTIDRPLIMTDESLFVLDTNKGFYSQQTDIPGIDTFVLSLHLNTNPEKHRED